MNDSNDPLKIAAIGALRASTSPVLLSEVLTSLAPKAGETYIDATFGAGGYSRAILEAADCNVLALDRDPRAVRDAVAVCEQFPNRLTVVQAPFSRLGRGGARYLSTNSAEGEPSVFTPPDGIVFDIGVSSMQLDEAERGFSFQHDGPLDMRMSGDGESAADFVNTAERRRHCRRHLQVWRGAQIAVDRACHRQGARAKSRSPARSNWPTACRACSTASGSTASTRQRARFRRSASTSTTSWANSRRASPPPSGCLKPGGRLVVVTFHSLEDRIVKQFLIDRAGLTPRGSRYLPESIKISSPSFRIVNSRPLTPEKGELDVNPRARSARLRAAIRTEAPAQS